MVRVLRPRREQNPDLEDEPPHNNVPNFSEDGEAEQQPPVREVRVNLARDRLRREQPGLPAQALDRDASPAPARREGSQAQRDRDRDHRDRRSGDRDRDHRQQADRDRHHHPV